MMAVWFEDGAKEGDKFFVGMLCKDYEGGKETSVTSI
jgi:hypothetical protein